MKRLILVRHAKSDWSSQGISDIDRPLNERGYENAHRMGAFLKDKFSDNVLFVSSPAIRALSTALIFAQESGYEKKKIVIDEKLYEANEKVYTQLISSINNKVDTAFIFGHNPTTSEVLSALTGNVLEDLPTCSVVVIAIATDDWASSIQAEKRVEQKLSPKVLPV